MSRTASGFKAWLYQRLTAIYLGLYILYLLISLITLPSADYLAWKGWMGNDVNATLLILFFIALFWHSWIGFRDVIIDYIPPLSLRLTVLTLLASALIAQAVWVAVILFKPPI